MRSPLEQVLAKIDAFNAADPRGYEQPYSEQLTKWVIRMSPRASDALRIAARGQHIGRWTIPRQSYPLDRTGYLRWREELKRFHAQKVSALMCEEGYENDAIERVRSIILKTNLTTDSDAQILEDGLCLVFLESQLGELAAKTSEEKMIEIIRKTWKKMGPQGRELALGIPMPEDQKKLIQKALAQR